MSDLPGSLECCFCHNFSLTSTTRLAESSFFRISSALSKLRLEETKIKVQYVIYRVSALSPSPPRGTLNRYSALNQLAFSVQFTLTASARNLPGWVELRNCGGGSLMSDEWGRFEGGECPVRGGGWGLA